MCLAPLQGAKSGFETPSAGCPLQGAKSGFETPSAGRPLQGENQVLKRPWQVARLAEEYPNSERALYVPSSSKDAQAGGERPLVPAKLQMAGYRDFCHTDASESHSMEKAGR